MRKGEDYTGIVVSYFCHDGNGRYLFNKRGEGCRDEQGCWDNGGGGVEFGDTIETTLQNEISQEYCTTVLSYEFLGYRDVFRENCGKKTHWLALDFKVFINNESVRNGEPHKFDEIGWFTLDNLPSPLHSQVPLAIDLYREKLEAR